MHDFAKDEIAVLACAIGIQGHRLQHTVRLAALGLHGGAAVKAPKRKVSKCGRVLKCLELSLAAQLRNRELAV